MLRVLCLAILCSIAAGSAAAEEAHLALPTPKGFLKTFNADAEARQLLAEFLASLDPETRTTIMQLVEQSTIDGPPDLPKEQVRTFVQSTDWKKRERELLNQFVYRSQVLDLIPEAQKEFWDPIVFDALIYFLGNLPEERLFDLLWGMSRLPQDAARGEKIIALTDRIPTFQKLAQIIARNPAVPPDIRASLQLLENSIGTMGRDELVAYIREAAGDKPILGGDVVFGDRVLAEASIGAVIKVRGVRPGKTEPEDAAVKVIKPYALVGLPEELAVIDSMTRYFEMHREHYGIGDIPLTSVFQDLRAALEKEILVKQEKANLRRAADYYAANTRVHVPWLVESGGEKFTVMELVTGHKITDAFPGDREKRAIMARRLYDVLTHEPVFGGKGETLFHGDPHAGNVFHVTDNSEDPYQIALLDWGLMGRFTRKQREQLMQLFLGLEFKHRKRMRRNVVALIEEPYPEEPAKRLRLDEIFEETFAMQGTRSAYEQVGRLIELLLREGYKLDSQFALFIKAQLTIVGILAELDPDLDQRSYAEKKVRAQVKREIPKRLLLLPGWNYHGYKSLMSNEDVKDGIFK